MVRKPDSFIHEKPYSDGFSVLYGSLAYLTYLCFGAINLLFIQSLHALTMTARTFSASAVRLILYSLSAMGL
ncbi:MAG: hypothetical protein LBR47_01930 [Spirochaetaceae bacterium]|nr:hypothetical protein [Spirochaetaceae bacterium]